MQSKSSACSTKSRAEGSACAEQPINNAAHGSQHRLPRHGRDEFEPAGAVERLARERTADGRRSRRRRRGTLLLMPNQHPSRGYDTDTAGGIPCRSRMSTLRQTRGAAGIKGCDE